MQFKDWATSKGLIEEESSPKEISDLLKLVDEKLNDCQIVAGTTISSSSHYSIAYNAAIACATVVLRASGYRTNENAKGGHDLLFQSLGFTVDKRGVVVAQLNKARFVRRRTTYEAVENIDARDIHKLVETIRSLRKTAEQWIRKEYPDLLP